MDEPVAFKMFVASFKGGKPEYVQHFVYVPSTQVTRLAIGYGDVICLQEDKDNLVVLLEGQRLALRLRNAVAPRWLEFFAPAADFSSLSMPSSSATEPQRGQKVGEVNYLGFTCDVYILETQGRSAIAWVTEIGSETVELFNMSVKPGPSGYLTTIVTAVEALRGSDVPMCYLSIPSHYQVMEIEDPTAFERLYKNIEGSRNVLM